jgi:hypothetical protein
MLSNFRNFEQFESGNDTSLTPSASAYQQKGQVKNANGHAPVSIFRNGKLS